MKGMVFAFAAVNALIRSRSRLQGCLVLLLLVALITVLVLPSTTTVAKYDENVFGRITKSNEVFNQAARSANADSEAADSEIQTSTPSVTMSQADRTSSQPVPVPTIFAITPTKRRLTQLLDLTSLCQTLMNVQHLVWIVVESSSRRSPLVKSLLNNCSVQSVHLTSVLPGSSANITSGKYGIYALRRGARERNVGLKWIREHCWDNCTGVVYFMDDESKYDTRLFDKMRQVSYVGIWPVAFAGLIKFEGPVCVNGSVVEWHSLHSERAFPISNLGFAVNVECILDKSKAAFGFTPDSQTKSASGSEESDFLSNFLESSLDPRLECRGSNKEVYVWQVKSKIDPYLAKRTQHGKYKLKI